MPSSCWAANAALRHRSPHHVRSGGPSVASSRLSRLTPSQRPNLPHGSRGEPGSAFAEQCQAIAAGDLFVSGRLHAGNLALKHRQVVVGAFVVENHPIRVLDALEPIVVDESPLGKVAW